MVGKTHVAGGLLAGLALNIVLARDGMAAPTTYGQLATGLAISVAGGLFPDIDLHSSKAGNKAGPISWLIQVIFGHRTFFHSPFLIAILYYAANLYFDTPLSKTFSLFFLAGMASHLFLDMCNSKGIPLLYPFPKRFHIATVNTGGVVERGLRVILYAFCLLLMVQFMIF